MRKAPVEIPDDNAIRCLHPLDYCDRGFRSADLRTKFTNLWSKIRRVRHYRSIGEYLGSIDGVREGDRVAFDPMLKVVNSVRVNTRVVFGSLLTLEDEESGRLVLRCVQELGHISNGRTTYNPNSPIHGALVGDQIKIFLSEVFGGIDDIGTVEVPFGKDYWVRNDTLYERR